MGDVLCNLSDVTSHYIVRSLNEEEIKENLEYFKVPSASIDSIQTKLVMTIFDEYAKKKILYLLSSTLSRCGSLTHLGRRRREAVRRRKSN